MQGEIMTTCKIWESKDGFFLVSHVNFMLLPFKRILMLLDRKNIKICSIGNNISVIIFQIKQIKQHGENPGQF